MSDQDPTQSQPSLIEVNNERMYAIFTRMTTGSITPQQAASQIFIWLDKIVSGEEPPFDDFNYPVPVGDTPGMEQFTATFSYCLVNYAFSNRAFHDDLIAFTKEFYRLIGNRPWVCRGETMEKPMFAYSSAYSNSHPFEYFRQEETQIMYGLEVAPRPSDDEIYLMVINGRRFQALLENRLGFDWMRERLAIGFLDYHSNYELQGVLSAAEIIEIAGADMYRHKENWKLVRFTFEGMQMEEETWGVWEDKGGFVEEGWNGWMEKLQTIADDVNKPEEVKSAATRAVAMMAVILEQNK